MIRSLSWISVGAMMVSGCAGPIETRVQTHQVIAAGGQKQFIVTTKDTVENDNLTLARDLVTKSLTEKGYQPSPDASILVNVALAERPADIAIDAGDKDAMHSIATAKLQKRFQSCKDQEHRLTIILFDQTRGTKLYAGNASEYHCNGTIKQSLPFLVKSALSGLDSNPTDTARSASHTRQGIE